MTYMMPMQMHLHLWVPVLRAGPTRDASAVKADLRTSAARCGSRARQRRHEILSPASPTSHGLPHGRADSSLRLVEGTNRTLLSQRSTFRFRHTNPTAPVLHSTE